MLVVIIIIIVHKIRSGRPGIFAMSRWKHRVPSQQRSDITGTKGRLVKACHASVVSVKVHRDGATPPVELRLIVWGEASTRGGNRPLQAVEVEHSRHTARNARDTVTALQRDPYRPVYHVLAAGPKLSKRAGSDALQIPRLGKWDRSDEVQRCQTVGRTRRLAAGNLNPLSNPWFQRPDSCSVQRAGVRTAEVISAGGGKGNSWSSARFVDHRLAVCR